MSLSLSFANEKTKLIYIFPTIGSKHLDRIQSVMAILTTDVKTRQQFIAKERAG